MRGACGCCAAAATGGVAPQRRGRGSCAFSLYDLIGAPEDRRRDRHAERISGLQVESQRLRGKLRVFGGFYNGPKTGFTLGDVHGCS